MSSINKLMVFQGHTQLSHLEPLSTELVLVHYADERKKMGREMKKAL